MPTAGWYTDPSGRFRERWWDGARWGSAVVPGRLRIRSDRPDASWAPPTTISTALPLSAAPEWARGPRWVADPDGQERLRWWDGSRWTDQVATRAGTGWATASVGRPWEGHDRHRDRSVIGRTVGIVIIGVGLALLVATWALVMPDLATSDPSFDLWFFGPLGIMVVGAGIVVVFPPRRVRSRDVAIGSIVASCVSMAPFGVLLAPVLLPVATIAWLRAVHRADDPDGVDVGRAHVAGVTLVVAVALVIPVYLFTIAFANAMDAGL